MRRFAFFLFGSLLPFFASAQCAYKGGKPDFLPQILCKSDFKVLQGKPLSDKYGNVSAVKVVYQLRQDKLYFIQSAKYRLHYDFCNAYLHEYNNLSTFNTFEYSDSKARKYVIANLNHYESADLYTLEFFADDKVSAELISRLYDKIKGEVYFGEQLKILLNSPQMEQKMAGKLPTISVSDLYASQAYQNLNMGSCYGRLRKVAVADFGRSHFSPDEVLVTDGLPNEFPICEGILTAAFQTPLCHVNVLSSNRGTPNAACKNIWNNAKLDSMQGKYVYYAVQRDTFVLRLADSTELRAYQANKQRKRKTIILQKDSEYAALVDARKLNKSYLKQVGGKAAHFGELAHITLPNGKALPIPEGAFAIPFRYYEQHLQTHHVVELIERVLKDSLLQTDAAGLDSALKVVRSSIKDAPIDPKLIQMVEQQIRKNKLPYTAYRFRSSTNAEDVAGFNGAGLYDSKTGVLGATDKKTIEKAIKTVWASAWNLRAFQERAYFNIDQRSVAMGILVHRAFGEEAANGVAVTANLYRKGYPSFTVNVQKGETSVVLPENDSLTCDQFIIHLFSQKAGNRNQFTVEYITKSNLNGGKNVLNEAEIQLLAQYLAAIKQHFHFLYGASYTGSYNDFAVDVEFKLDKETRRLYVKQARLYR